VGAEELLSMGREMQARDLGRCSVCVQTGASGAVPYVDGRVVCASAGREQVGLPRGPSESLSDFMSNVQKKS
jgi:N-acetylmuramic acid 6-phosphate (MurNAc-6-P) etherase